VAPGVKTLWVILPFGELYSQSGGAIATVTRNVVRVWEEQGITVTVFATGAADDTGPAPDLYPALSSCPVPRWARVS
jgi:hypothetical protein